MTCYSVQPRDWIFVKGYGFLSFAKNMGKHIDKNISKNLSSKYSQKHIDHAKKFANKTSPQNNSETNEEEILRERYISPKLRQKIINYLRLKAENYWRYIIIC